MIQSIVNGPISVCIQINHKTLTSRCRSWWQRTIAFIFEILKKLSNYSYDGFRFLESRVEKAEQWLVRKYQIGLRNQCAPGERVEEEQPSQVAVHPGVFVMLCLVLRFRRAPYSNYAELTYIIWQLQHILLSL